MQVAVETIEDLRAKDAQRPFLRARLGVRSPTLPTRLLPPPVQIVRTPAAPRKIEIVDCEPDGAAIDVAVCRSDVVLVMGSSAKPGAQFIIDPQDYRIELAKIVRVVAKHFGVRVGEVFSHNRIAMNVHARQVAMYLAKALTSASYPKIGRYFHGRDESTVKHAVRKMASLAHRDADLARDIEVLTEKLIGEVIRQ